MVSFADDQQGLLVFTARFYRVCPYEHGLREFQAVVFLLNSFVIMNFFTDSEFERFQGAFYVCKPSRFTRGKGGNEAIPMCFVERVVLFGGVKS